MPSIPATAAIPGGHPFSFVEPGHPLRGDLERFWDSATRVPALSRLLVLDGAAPRQRSVLRLYPTGRARLKWLSVSVQRQTATGFSSVTLHYRASRRLLLVHELPHDPLLPALPALGGEVAEVLQYVPRRRFTFRAPSPRADIGKCVRPSDLGGAWMRLRAVWEAVQRAGVSFAVAEPRRLDGARSAFYQGALPGRDLAGVIDGSNVTALLYRAGRIHAELHSLEVSGVPRWSPHELLPALRKHAELVALFRPDATQVVQAALQQLVESTPSAAPVAFCHGDLRCGHLLEHEGRWAVIDLDGCRLGDPCQDIARLLAFLKRDVPYLRERFSSPQGGHDVLNAAIVAFLTGYAAERAAPLEPARLTWYLLAHELHFLARMFKRDLYDPLAFQRGRERLVLLGELLRERLGGRRRP